ncbi:MAG: lytic transglycosylase domain-containing protein [Elusimicrobia bacterium]|nr:lytic transglycosylase domain-containing protein [Elusimicrobiota bacterium]
MNGLVWKLGLAGLAAWSAFPASPLSQWVKGRLAPASQRTPLEGVETGLRDALAPVPEAPRPALLAGAGPLAAQVAAPPAAEAGGVERAEPVYPGAWLRIARARGDAKGLAIERILASEGIAVDDFGVLAPPAKRGRSARLFKAAGVLELGGRLGQGTVSLDGGAAATREDFEPRAGGLGWLPPEEEAEGSEAPALPPDHLAAILQAATAAGIEPALLAAVAARESGFVDRAYRAEPHLRPVAWASEPGRAPTPHFDAAMGPAQVLRSNLKASGIEDDEEAFRPAANYRAAARVLRASLDAFRGDLRKAVEAYAVGDEGVRARRAPAGYADAVLSWRGEYARVLDPYRAGS